MFGFKKAKKDFKILKILSATPGGRHSWVEARIGNQIVKIRKENKNINI